MKILFISIFIMVSAFVIHAVIWRIKKPMNVMKHVMTIYFSVLTVILATVYFLSTVMAIVPSLALNCVEYIHISLIFILYYLVYILIIASLHEESAAIKMIEVINKGGEAGVEKKELNELISNDSYIQPRILDLERDQWLYLKGDRFLLTTRGALVLRIIVLYRKLMNLPIVGA